MQPAAPAYYDIIIKNAVVIDGTGRKRFVSDIGILNERVAFIGDLKQAKAVLEFHCKGKLVASPGFVDMHSHSDLMIFSDDPTSHVNRGDLPKIKQGVTLQVVGQDGLSLAPVRPVARVDLATKMSGLCGVIDDPWDWEQVSDYLAKAEGRLAVNMAFLVGHCTVREYVMGPTDREANIRDRLQMGEVVKRAMHEGAFGFSTGLIYEPAMFADFKELDHLARIVAQHNGFFVAHIRNETDRVIEAVVAEAERELVAENVVQAYRLAFDARIRVERALGSVKNVVSKPGSSDTECASSNCNTVCCMGGYVCCTSDAHCTEEDSCDTERFYCVGPEGEPVTAEPRGFIDTIIRYKEIIEVGILVMAGIGALAAFFGRRRSTQPALVQQQAPVAAEGWNAAQQQPPAAPAAWNAAPQSAYQDADYSGYWDQSYNSSSAYYPTQPTEPQVAAPQGGSVCPYCGSMFITKMARCPHCGGNL